MSKIRFVINNAVDGSILTDSPTMDVNLPIDNVKDTSRSKVTRSQDASDQIIRGTFSAAKKISAAVIGRHNFVVDMQYRLSIYNNNNLDTSYSNTGGTESANDTFYIAGDQTLIFPEAQDFDVIGDTGYTFAAATGTDNTSPTKDVFEVVGNVAGDFIAGQYFDYSGDTTTASNKRYTITSSVFASPNTEITVEEDCESATFDGTLAPHARYSVNTGGATLNATTYAVTGGVDNTDPTNDVFYVAGDQSAIFNRATSVTCSGDTNATSNITYTITNVTYNGGSVRTEITVEEDVTGHSFDGDLLPIYTSVPVATNIITNPNFDGTLLPDFLVWTSGLLNVDVDSAGSALWTWGEFLWGVEAWGSDKTTTEFTPSPNLVIWLDQSYANIRGFKLEIFAAGAAVSYFEIGRMILGDYIQPTYNIGYGHSLSWQESTKQFRTDAGTLRSDISVPYRKIEFSLGTISEDDRVLLQHELRNVGLRKDFFVSLFPEDESRDKKLDYSGIVKLTKIPKFTEFAQNYYKSKYIMEEV